MSMTVCQPSGVQPLARKGMRGQAPPIAATVSLPGPSGRLMSCARAGETVAAPMIVMMRNQFIVMFPRFVSSRGADRPDVAIDRQFHHLLATGRDHAIEIVAVDAVEGEGRHGGGGAPGPLAGAA